MASSDTQFKLIHGRSLKTGVPNDPTYIAWYSMRQRCNYARHKSFSRYGGAGISICERWNSFPKFLEDMGERPLGMTIDRWPNRDGNYEPGNCRWATAKEQARNRKNNRLLPAFGEVKVAAEWCELFGIAQDTLNWRIKSGMPVEVALTKPVASSHAFRGGCK